MKSENTPSPLNATLDEAAAYLKVAKRTIQGYQERGLLKPVYFGKLRRFRWEEIRQLEKTGVQSGDPGRLFSENARRKLGSTRA